MRRISIFIPLIFLCSVGYSEEFLVQDRIEVKGGAILTGTIELVSESTILLVTDYAGALEVGLAKVERISLNPVRDIGVPVALLETAEATSAQGTVADKDAGKAASKPEVAQKPKEPAAEEVGAWKLEARLGLDGRGGNSDRFLSTFSVKAELERRYDRFNLDGRYTFLKDRGKKKPFEPYESNEVIVGGRYTNFFYKKFGIFFREELETDRYEEIDLRSTSASGISFQFVKSKNLRMESRAGFSYRYEYYTDSRDEGFPGMDFGLDALWKFAEWGSFSGAYSYVPSVKQLDSYIIQQDSFIDLPLKASNLWKFRLGINSQYNSNPRQGREDLDFKYYASLIASWKSSD